MPALLDSVRSQTDSRGRRLADDFEVLPTRRELPLYYQTIAQPIDLKTIDKRLAAGHYGDALEAMEADLQLMLDNAKAFNEVGSRIHRDAIRLGKLLSDPSPPITTTLVLPPSGGGGGGKRRSVRQQLIKLLEGVKGYTNKEGYVLSSVFAKVPSRREEPNYETVITYPMDIRTIEERLQNNYYQTLSDMLTDLDHMFRNATTYNPRGHSVHADALELKKFAHKHARALEQADLPLSAATPTQPNPPFSGAEAAMSDEDMASLLENVVAATDRSGRLLSAWFEQLPSSSDYPDYYELISTPIDLRAIRRKVKKRTYASVVELQADLKLMINNAKFYNESTSEVYKNAAALEKVVDKQLARFQGSANPADLRLKLKVSQDTPPPSTASSLRFTLKLPEKKLSAAQEAVTEACDKLLAEVMRARTNKRKLRDAFLQLPTEEEAPGYLNAVTQPMTITMVANKISAHGYSSLAQCIQELELVFDNALNFYPAGSTISRDAATLRELVGQVAGDHQTTATTSMVSGPPMQAAVYSLVEPIMQAIMAVRTNRRKVHEPFLELPDRKVFSDYYKVIKKPRSLLEIRAALDADKYAVCLVLST